jgi:hypothetical protein
MLKRKGVGRSQRVEAHATSTECRRPAAAGSAIRPRAGITLGQWMLIVVAAALAVNASLYVALLLNRDVTPATVSTSVQPVSRVITNRDKARADFESFLETVRQLREMEASWASEEANGPYSPYQPLVLETY